MGLTLPRDLPRTEIRGPRSFPVLGTTGNFLGFFRDPVGTMLDLHARFGRLATVADRDPAVLFAFDPAHNQVVLSDPRRFANFAEPLFEVPPGSASSRLGQALTGMNGDLHKRHRRMLLPAFQRSALGGYQADMVAITRACAEKLAPGAAIDGSAFAVDLTLRIALRCLFGVDPPADRSTEGLGDLAVRYLQGLISPGAMLLPYDWPGTPYRRFLRTADALEAELSAIIARRRAEGTAGHDMLSILLRARDDDDGSVLTEAELLGHSTLMFIAGHETTAFTLGWALFLLAMHPPWMERVQEEVDAVLGDREPTLEDLPALVVMDRVLKETQRLLPASVFLFFRCADVAFTLGDHALPPRSMVILSPLVTHRLPETFPEPLRFRPDRWEGLAPSPYAYLPFGAGPRLCIGASFAAQALRIALAWILRRHSVELADGVDVSRKVQGITMGPKHGLPMTVRPRGWPIRRPQVVRGDVHALVDLG